jgi:hypothetical protein
VNPNVCGTAVGEDVGVAAGAVDAGGVLAVVALRSPAAESVSELPPHPASANATVIAATA